MTVGTTFLVIKTLMEKALEKPNWLVTTRITPSFPAKKNPFIPKKIKNVFDFLSRC